MDLSKLSQKDREKVIREHQKADFTSFCKHYFTTFGWQWEEDDGRIYVQRHVPALERYEVIVVNSPYENFPKTKELKSKILENSLILASPELSARWQGRGIKKQDQHTASGINFTYFKK